jgi:hypothetical protein
MLPFLSVSEMDTYIAEQKLRRQRIRQKNYSKLEQCLAEYEESLTVKSHMSVFLATWLPTAIVHNVLLEYVDVVHVKLLGYISKNIGHTDIFKIMTPYEEVTYSPSTKQHDLLKHWIKELESVVMALNHHEHIFSGKDELLLGEYCNGGWLLEYYVPSEQKWAPHERDCIVISEFEKMHIPMLSNLSNWHDID